MNELFRWERCPICSSTDFSVIDTGDEEVNRRTICRCHACSHAFCQYVPNDIMPQYFERKYWENDKNRQGIFHIRLLPEWEPWLNARLNLLDAFHLLDDSSSPHSGQKKALEFGCAEGMVLYALKQRGWDVYGNEVGAIAEESSKELGIPISRLPAEEFCKTTNQTFDLIMSFHVAEHLRDPLTVIKGFAKMLNPGGKMLLHVPVDDQEFGNLDHFHFFTNESCLKLMEQITTDIQSDFIKYPIRPGASAVAATYVGIRKED